MVYFPDGSRIWISHNDGTPIPEYQMEVARPDQYAETRTIYIPSEKGKEFVVNFQIARTKSWRRKTEIWIDGTRARSIHNSIFDKPRKCEGCYATPSTLQRFAFGAIDTSEKSAELSFEQKKAAMLKSSIEVKFYDAAVEGGYRAPKPLQNPLNVAEAVHPDSKQASMVGTQVKKGSVAELGKVKMTPSYRLYLRPQAVFYTAAFLYRPQGMLIAHDIMTEENLVRDDVKSAKLSTAAAKEAGSYNAGPPYNAGSGSSENAGVDAAGPSGETEAQRYARLREELMVKEEMNGELPDDPDEIMVLEDFENDVKPDPRLLRDDVAKKEPEIDNKGRVKPQKLYFDLTEEADD